MCPAPKPGHDRGPAFIARKEIEPQDRELFFPAHENQRSRTLGLDKLESWNFLRGGSGAEGQS
jgi:hypothetical protein